MQFNIDLLKRYLGDYYWHIAIFIALVYALFRFVDGLIVHFTKNVLMQSDLLGLEFLIIPLLIALVTIIIGAYLKKSQIDKENDHTFIKTIGEQFFVAFENLNVGMVILDTKGNILTCNKSVLQMLGYERDEFVNHNHIEFQDEEAFKLSSEYFSKMLNNELPYCELENTVLTKEGKNIWVKTSATSIKDENNIIKYVIVNFEFIDEKKRTRKALEESEKKYATLIQDIAIGIGILTLEGKLIDCNRSMEKIFGSSKEELSGYNLGDISHPEDKELYIKTFTELALGKKDFARLEKRFYKGDGTIIWTYLTGSLIRDDEGKPHCIIGMVEDITDKKEDQKVIDEYKEEIQFIYDSISDGILMINIENKQFINYNDAFCEIFGYTRDEMINVTWYDLHPQEYIQDCEEIFARVINQIKGFAPEVPAVKKNGEIFYIDFSTSIFNYKGQKTLVGFIRDVTQRREAEQSLKDSQARYKAIVDGFEGYICIISQNAEITFMNDNLINKLGNDLTGKKCFEVLFGLEKTCPHCKKEIVLKGQILKEEIFNPLDNRWYYSVHSPITHADGETSVLLLFRDITELKNTRADLEKERNNLEFTVNERTQKLQESLKKLEVANLHLEEVSNHKSKFLSTMSHEFRTPLNAILGFADLLNGQFFGELNSKQLEYVGLINTSGKHLLDLINDLLDITKIDAGAMELQLESFNFDDLLEEIINLMSNQFKTKKHMITFNCQYEKLKIITDRRKCNQIMLNLLSNAYKYTPIGGTIKIESYTENNSLFVRIQDSGIGINDEQIDKVFSEFYQVDRVRDATLGGTGIGLALTKRLVELQGGEIGVQSIVNEGSTFWFSLPLKSVNLIENSTEYSPETTIKSVPRQKRILVVEDNETNIAMILDQLRIYDHNIAVAKNGKEALDLIYSHKPELILMDMIMPLMDGIEATKIIKSIEEFKNIPIIAMTASAGFEAKKRHMQAGCDEQLEKPLDSKELRQILIKYLSENV